MKGASSTAHHKSGVCCESSLKHFLTDTVRNITGDMRKCWRRQRRANRMQYGEAAVPVSCGTGSTCVSVRNQHWHPFLDPTCRRGDMAATTVDNSRAFCRAHGANALCRFLILHFRSYRTVSGCHWIFNEQNTEWNISWRRLWVTWPCLPVSGRAMQASALHDMYCARRVC